MSFILLHKKGSFVQNRGDLFWGIKFKHKNQAFPPPLSTRGNIRIGNKAHLLQCLEKDTVFQAPDIDVKILQLLSTCCQLENPTPFRIMLEMCS